MSYRALLSRIRKLFRTSADTHFSRIEAGLKTGRIPLPAVPMTDQELAHAIREFRKSPVTDWTLSKLGKRFEGD